MSLSVFMLEDDPNVAGVVRDVAESEGWRFGSADRTTGILEALRDFGPDLILLDVELPDGNGFEVCRQIRAERVLAAIPVIFLTGKGDVEHRLKGFEVGGQDYIGKPFSVAELAARIRAHLSIKRGIDELHREREELALKERAQRDLADMVVHDMRTPLTAIRITLDMLRESRLVSDPDHASLLDAAEANAQFLILMVNDLLDLGAGQLKLEPAPLDLPALSRKLKATFAHLCERKKIKFELDLPQPGRSAVADGVVLFRVLANLVSNAVKFSRPGEQVSVGARALPSALRLDVGDQGPGIPDAEKERVFDMRYRTDFARKVGVPGTGIGLAFCRFACQALGGRVWVEDRPGGGSRFVVEIPWAPAGKVSQPSPSAGAT